VPTNRERRPRYRHEVRVPQWAQALLSGVPPDRDSEDGQAYFGWRFMGDAVPGLPDADSRAGQQLTEAADAYKRRRAR
jgi:hypothetical protein